MCLSSSCSLVYTEMSPHSSHVVFHCLLNVHLERRQSAIYLYRKSLLRARTLKSQKHGDSIRDLIRKQKILTEKLKNEIASANESDLYHLLSNTCYSIASRHRLLQLAQ